MCPILGNVHREQKERTLLPVIILRTIRCRNPTMIQANCQGRALACGRFTRKPIGPPFSFRPFLQDILESVIEHVRQFEDTTLDLSSKEAQFEQTEYRPSVQFRQKGNRLMLDTTLRSN